MYRVLAANRQVKERRRLARHPAGLLMRASSRNAVKDELDMMIDSCLALHQTADLL